MNHLKIICIIFSHWNVFTHTIYNYCYGIFRCVSFYTSMVVVLPCSRCAHWLSISSLLLLLNARSDDECARRRILYSYALVCVCVCVCAIIGSLHTRIQTIFNYESIFFPLTKFIRISSIHIVNKLNINGW